MIANLSLVIDYDLPSLDTWGDQAKIVTLLKESLVELCHQLVLHQVLLHTYLTKGVALEEEPCKLPSDVFLLTVGEGLPPKCSCGN